MYSNYVPVENKWVQKYGKTRFYRQVIERILLSVTEVCSSKYYSFKHVSSIFIINKIKHLQIITFDFFFH